MKDPTQSLETFHIPVDEVEARIKSASDQLDSFVRTRAAAFASSSSEAQQQSQRHAGRVLSLYADVQAMFELTGVFWGCV